MDSLVLQRNGHGHPGPAIAAAVAQPNTRQSTAGIPQHGNYAGVNGLRMLGVESCVLVGSFLVALVGLRFLPRLTFQSRWLNWILGRGYRSTLLVIAVALLSRALLLPVLGIPEPRINDEYSYLLMADTFSHGRLANPTPAEWPHFETFWVNLLPTYHSKYPVSQGIILALGEMLFREPWIGVYLSTAALCGAICWSLQAFVPPGWALLGGLLAVLRLALFSYWMNSYWGGSMAALGGALALGAVVRLFGPSRTERDRWALTSLFAISLLLLATSRPFEGLAFAIPLMVYFGYNEIQLLRRRMPLTSTLFPIVLIGLAGASMMGYYNSCTTGNPLLLPHVLNERTYSPLPLFLWQKGKPDLEFRDPAFAKFYRVAAEEYKYDKARSIAGLKSLEVSRFLQGWFFFVGPALTLPVLIGFISSLQQERKRLVVCAALSTGVAFALSFYTMMHYAAPATIAVYLFAVEGLRCLWSQRRLGEQAFVVAVCVTVTAVCLSRQTATATLDTTFATPNNRKLIEQQLESKPGQQLVLVSYDLERHYPGDELVHNGADFESEKILWARSKGPEKDRQLCAAYPRRTFWTVRTDDLEFSLQPSDLCKGP